MKLYKNKKMKDSMIKNKNILAVMLIAAVYAHGGMHFSENNDPHVWKENGNIYTSTHKNPTAWNEYRLTVKAHGNKGTIVDENLLSADPEDTYSIESLKKEISDKNVNNINDDRYFDVKVAKSRLAVAEAEKARDDIRFAFWRKKDAEDTYERAIEQLRGDESTQLRRRLEYLKEIGMIKDFNFNNQMSTHEVILK